MRKVVDSGDFLTFSEICPRIRRLPGEIAQNCTQFLGTLSAHFCHTVPSNFKNFNTNQMRITRKPNYTNMAFDTYREQVFHAIERRLGEDGAGLLCLGYDANVIAQMLHDAVTRFKNLNLSPDFTASQVITLLNEVNVRRTN